MWPSSFDTLMASRVWLRPVTLADAPAIFAYRSLPEVARFQHTDMATVCDAERFIRGASAQPVEPGGWLQLAICLMETGALVGDIGLCNEAVSPDGEGAIMVGYTLSPVYQGHGLATEAVSVLMGYLFAGGVHRISASVDPANGPSVRLLLRIGMRHEGTHREAVLVKGEWRDDSIYALLKEEWETRGERVAHCVGGSCEEGLR